MPALSRLDGRVLQPVLALPLTGQRLGDGAAPDHQAVRGPGVESLPEDREAALLVGGVVLSLVRGLAPDGLPDVADVDMFTEKQEEGADRAEDQEEEGGEELVDGEGLAGPLLLHVGLTHAVQPVPAQPLQVAVLSVLQQLGVELRPVLGVVREGKTVPSHCRPAPDLHHHNHHHHLCHQWWWWVLFVIPVSYKLEGRGEPSVNNYKLGRKFLQTALERIK